MSLAVRILVWLVLYFRQGEGKLNCQISQKELIIVAVVNESVRFSCEYKCKLAPQPETTAEPPAEPIPFTVQLYKGNRQNIVAMYSGADIEPIFTEGWVLRVSGTEYSGMYYCLGKSESSDSRGRGTFLQVRDTGYMEPPPSLVLRSVLVGLCMLLLLYSVSATSVVLIKRKVCSRCKSHRMKTSSPVTRQFTAVDQMPVTSESQHVSAGEWTAEPAESDNAYMALQRHQESLYCKLDSDSCNDPAGNKSPKQPNVPMVEVGAEAEVYECVYESF